jgi:hypothetical protein
LVEKNRFIRGNFFILPAVIPVAFYSSKPHRDGGGGGGGGGGGDEKKRGKKARVV